MEGWPQRVQKQQTPAEHRVPYHRPVLAKKCEFASAAASSDQPSEAEGRAPQLTREEDAPATEGAPPTDTARGEKRRAVADPSEDRRADERVVPLRDVVR